VSGKAKERISALWDISGRTAIVTGGGQGLGRAIARALADAGVNVVIAELNETKAQAVVEEIASEGGAAIAVKTDVADWNSVQAMVTKTIATFGRIDILINNAGIFSTLKMRPFDQIPIDEWELVMKVNITGVMLCSRAVVPHMRAEGWGRIVNMSSGSISLGRPNYLHYTTSKSALIGMSRSMARELGPSGITVNALLPGAVFTEIPRETVTPAQKESIVKMQCIPRAQAPVDLVGTILYLCSPGSEFMTGQSVNLDGGATHS
jgi:NAD(P)-dependent dehydrogenase (short-subunit alcohol dehydrogenase family)